MVEGRAHACVRFHGLCARVLGGRAYSSRAKCFTRVWHEGFTLNIVCCMPCRTAGRHADALAAYDRAIAVGREAADPAMREADLQVWQTSMPAARIGDAGVAASLAAVGTLMHVVVAGCQTIQTSKLAESWAGDGSAHAACSAPRIACSAASVLARLVKRTVICSRLDGTRSRLHGNVALAFAKRRRAQVAMVRALHAMGGAYREAAASVITGLLEREPAHAGALAAYAGMAIERGMAADAMHVLLSLLVRRPDDTDVRCSLRATLDIPLLTPLLYLICE